MSTIAIDLDDVLCKRSKIYEDIPGKKKYTLCQPIQRNIDKVNQWYDDGHKIIIYTARGMTQYKGNIIEIYDELYNFTEDQLKRWNIKYDSLVMGKIHYDLIIDDKALNSKYMRWHNVE